MSVASADEWLTIPQVQLRLQLKSYGQAYALVNSGALGEVLESDAGLYTRRKVSAAAVRAYLEKKAPALQNDPSS